MNKLTPLKIDSKNEYVVAKIISTITKSRKKAQKRVDKVIDAFERVLTERICDSEDSKEIEILRKTFNELRGASIFIEETCMGLRFPGSWLDFDENGGGKYAAAFGILFTKTETGLKVDVGCKIAVNTKEESAAAPFRLPMFYNFEQKFVI